MTIHFYLRYQTTFGETLSLKLGNEVIAMDYLNEEFWFKTVDTSGKKLSYTYLLNEKDGTITEEWSDGKEIDLTAVKGDECYVFDFWNAAATAENVFFSNAFQEILLPKSPKTKAGNAKNATHIFKIKAPLLLENEAVCLSGNGEPLGKWNTEAPILMQRDGLWWSVALDLTKEVFPVAYKYGIYNTKEKKFKGFESGNNRVLHTSKPTVLHDGFARFSLPQWKGSGVAIPIFSLRSQESFGVGEFSDMKLLTDWAKSVGMKLIQLLPINDTNATKTWTDSYPYAAISAFAFNPIYLNLSKVAGKTHAALVEKLESERKVLNALPVVDYETVLKIKLETAKVLYLLEKENWLKNADYQAFFEKNKHWLVPYAAFCHLRDENKTSDFNQWKKHNTYDVKAIEKLSDPKGKGFDAIGIHYFMQYHLHLQLKEATDYAHQNGIAIKGDIPIGIYRYSCDAWVEPELYNMNWQAGAPPDDFAVLGQNWGFPTYNWERMKADGFAWWRKRFEQMGDYFDAFRIDHILGFFRIWSIPLDAVEGIMGHFVPAIPIGVEEFENHGVRFDYERFCKPYINREILYKFFGDAAEEVKSDFLTESRDGLFHLKPEFSTQRLVEAHFEKQTKTDRSEKIKLGLYNLISNVLLFEEGTDRRSFHFRYGIDKTASFQYLNPSAQKALNALYTNYFFRRQDEFWRKEAMEKLPALKRVTNMFICGEDLGMVPDCVPGVMKSLGFLSLEIQRMPKAVGTTFLHPKDAPYMSVITPSTHDMSTLREWWEEDRKLTQRFYNEIMSEHGTAPYFCEPWICKKLVEQHLHSPAMWSIFQLQDLMGIDGTLRRENPMDERINVPANPKHYWQYRMHLTLEELKKQKGFNEEVREMIGGSGR